MIMDVVFELEERAKSLAKNLTIFQENLEEAETVVPEEIAEFQDMLKTMCEDLTKIHDLFEISNSPLQEIKKRLGPTKSTLDPDGIGELLKDHTLFLRRIGMDPKSIDEAINWIDQLKSELLEPQDINTSEITATIGELKSQICKISNNTEYCTAALDLDHVKAITDGAIGVCIITVDVTGAFTVPDPTAFTYIKAIKSTYSGVKKVRSSIGSLKEFLAPLEFEKLVRPLRGRPLRLRRRKKDENAP